MKLKTMSHSLLKFIYFFPNSVYEMGVSKSPIIDTEEKPPCGCLSSRDDKCYYLPRKIMQTSPEAQTNGVSFKYCNTMPFYKIIIKKHPHHKPPMGIWTHSLFAFIYSICSYLNIPLNATVSIQNA